MLGHYPCKAIEGAARPIERAKACEEASKLWLVVFDLSIVFISPFQFDGWIFLSRLVHPLEKRCDNMFCEERQRISCLRNMNAG